MTAAGGRGNPWALSGVFFVALFIAGLVLSGMLAPAPYPLPGASSAEIELYFSEGRIAVLMLGFLQGLSAISLFVFAACVAAFVRGTASGTRTLSELTLGGGTLAAAFLLLAALLSWVLALTVSEGGAAHASTLHYLIFLTGGPAHVASLAPFVGAGSIAALRTKTLPGWISWVGIAAAAISLLCLVSLVWYPASVFIPLGRVLSFVWCVAVSVMLVR
jgi:hypothetical protein